ncbi:patatin family protein [uncultured Treponema sp.]|uniref:patatin-like phospholipase family protein n=1 Tax=uncultured Treponema sp. TaxID=162155 RepID=UPI0015BB681B|nr:patatin family protein [uncultured Treponema sp.]
MEDYVKNKGKTGLVLEGGAMRGLFTAGVLDVFMENNILADGVAAVSADATFGCNYKSRQIGRTIRYNRRFSKDWRYASFRSLVKTGDFYGADFCYNRIPNELDVFDFETFRKNPIPFFVAATDCKTGKAVYKNLESGDACDLTWMRASASMPLVSRPVEIDGYTLLDGGMTDSIPLEFLESQGFERNIVILTQPRDYVKKKNLLVPLFKVALKKYPAVAQAMKNRHIMYNRQTEYVFAQEKKGSVFVICPEKSLKISRTEKNPAELQRVYDIGRLTAENLLESLKNWLAAGC